MNIDQAKNRYYSDPAFHTLVESFYHMMFEKWFTRDEIGSALFLAAVQVLEKEHHNE